MYPSENGTIDGMSARQATTHLLVIALVGAVGLAACGSDEGATESTDAADPASTDAAAADSNEPAEEPEPEEDAPSEGGVERDASPRAEQHGDQDLPMQFEFPHKRVCV